MSNVEIKTEQNVNEDEISLMDLIAVIARRWKFIFFSTLIAAVLIFSYSLYTLKAAPDAPFNKLPNVYKPQVIVRLQESNSSSSLQSLLGSSDLGLLSGLVSTSGGSSNSDLAMALIKGNIIADQIAEEFDFIERFGIIENPVSSGRRIYSESLTTEFDSATGFLTIGFESTDPVFATDVVNRSLELLEDRFRGLTMENIITKKAFLEERLVEQENTMIESQNKLINFQMTYGIIDMAAQTEAQVSEITELNSDLIQKEVELNNLLEKRRPEDPQVKRLENDIKSLRDLIDAKTTGFQDFQSTSDYIPKNKLPELAAMITYLETDVTLQSQLFFTFKSQLESVRLEEADNSKQFQIIERAEIPELKSAPSRGKICMIVTIAVMFLSIFLSFIMEYFARIKADPVESKKLEEIKHSLSLRK